MAKGLTLAGGLITLILIYLIGFGVGTTSIDGISIIRTFIENIGPLFSGMWQMIVMVILGFLFALSPIFILIGIKVRALAIIFGIFALLPGIGLVFMLIADAISNVGLGEIGSILGFGPSYLNNEPLFAGIFPLWQLIPLDVDTMWYIISFGSSVGGILAIIGGAKKSN